MRSVLITGCRGGIGLEFVKQLLNHKSKTPEILIATCRKIKEAPELKELATTNCNLHLLELELSDFDVYDDFSKKVERIVGDEGLNVLLHNAGLLRTKEPDIELVTVEDLLDMFKVNSIAPVMLTKALLPLLKKASQRNLTSPLGVDKAAVVCMSSLLGSISLNTKGGYWGYRESKAAVNTSFRSMTSEFSKQGISTLILHPGWVKTRMGGLEAPLTAEASVTGLLSVLLELSSETNGVFLQHDGKCLPW